MSKERKKKEKKLSIKNNKIQNKKKESKHKSIIENDIFLHKPELIELLIPDCIQEKRDQIILGEERYSRSFVLATYPSKTYIGWLDKIFSQIGDINISINVETVSDDTVIRQLTKKVTVLESEYQTYQSRGNIDLLHPLEKMIFDYEDIRKKIQTNNDRLFFISIMLRVNAKSLEELNNKSNILKNEFAKISSKVRTLNFRQFDGLIANLPINTSNIHEYERNVTAEGLATMFPISNSNSESSPNGVLIGRNIFTGLPVYLDLFGKELANPHMAILR